jgi:outer membrane receptor protein involved in Fe transport
MRIVRKAQLAAALVLSASLAAAQGTGSLSVQVVGDDGLPLPGATITLTHDTGNVKATSLLTDKDGWARFPVLQPGSGYNVEAAFPGFAIRREANVRVPISQEFRLTIQLTEEVIERVKVVARPDVVELEKTASTTRFSEEFVQDLPVPGRFYQNVLTLAPGVNDPDNDGNPTVHGSRSRDFQAVVGGVSNVDPLTGQYMSLINMDSIEEIEVITGGASVEFGRAQGGFANIIQKQGTNDFEGTFTFLFRSSVFDGDGAADDSNLPDPEFESIQPAIQVSGPIIKDKLWYRLSHDLTDDEIPVNVSTGIAVRTETQWVHSDALTWQVSPRNKLQFQFQSDPQEITNFGISSATPPESSIALDRSSETYSVKWTAPYSPKILVDTTASWQDLTNELSPSQTGVLNDCDEAALAGAQCFNLDTQQVSGSYNSFLEQHSQRLTLKSTATVYAGQLWGANHQFRLGVSIENERFDRDLDRGPTIFSQSIGIGGNDNQDQQTGGTCQSQTGGESSNIECQRDSQCPAGEACVEGQGLQKIDLIVGQFAVPRQAVVTAKGANWAFFFEDQIRPLSNLVVTVGGRVDREEIRAAGAGVVDPDAESAAFFDDYRACWLNDPFPHQNCPDFRDDNLPGYFTFDAQAVDKLFQIASDVGFSTTNLDQLLDPTLEAADSSWTKNRQLDDIDIGNTNFSPYLSISWDPWNNNKTQLAFTARRYYDKIVLSVPLLELEPSIVPLALFCRIDPDTKQRECNLSNGLNPASTVFSVDRNLKTPFQDEYRLVFTRELFTETLLRVEYIRRKYRDQLQDIDLNHGPGDYGRCDFRNGTQEVLPNDLVGLFDPETFPGDGVFSAETGNTWDDCVGRTEEAELAGGGDPGGGGGDTSQTSVRDFPDSRPDLYALNPVYNRYFYVSNVNQADYEGVVLELQRRQYRGWEMTGSYTWSMATGNGEDFAQLLGDDRSLVADEFGFQSNDQRHIVKFSATTITPWGFRLGGSARWESGLPYSCLLSSLSTWPSVPSYDIAAAVRDQQTVYCNDRRNDLRNDSFWNFDVKLTKEMNLGHSMNLQVSAEIFNLLNDGTYLVYEPDLEAGRQVNGTDFATPRFGREFQLGAKLAF